MASEIYKIINDIPPDYIKDLINIKKSNFRRENQASLPVVKSTRYHSLRSFRYEAARIWNSLLSPKWPEAGWLLPSVQETAPCIGWWHLRMSFMLNLGFVLLLQFSFNSLALPLLTSFRFLTPAFSHSFVCCKGCVSLGVCWLQSKCQKILNLINQIFPSYSAVSNSSRQQWVRWFIISPADVLYWYLISA